MNALLTGNDHLISNDVIYKRCACGARIPQIANLNGGCSIGKNTQPGALHTAHQINGNIKPVSATKRCHIDVGQVLDIVKLINCLNQTTAHTVFGANTVRIDNRLERIMIMRLKQSCHLIHRGMIMKMSRKITDTQAFRLYLWVRN